MLLTIGVPTYNRAESVSHLLHELAALPQTDSVEILVIDDGGSDGTFAMLSADPVIAARARVLRNDRNLGYPRTFARLFAECTTEYLMVIADDDEIVAENLPVLLENLEQHHPSFVSPQYLLGSTVQRGRTAPGPIAPRDFLPASVHAPGLVYRVEDCGGGLEELVERVEAEWADALIYPQVIIVMHLLLARGNCSWLAVPTVRAGANEPSGIRDANGRTYWSVDSRWQQLKAFDVLLARHVASDTTDVAQQMFDAHRQRVFRLMTNAFQLDDPALAAAFDSGAQKAYSRPAPSALGSLPFIAWMARLGRAISRRIRRRD